MRMDKIEDEEKSMKFNGLYSEFRTVSQEILLINQDNDSGRRNKVRSTSTSHMAISSPAWDMDLTAPSAREALIHLGNLTIKHRKPRLDHRSWERREMQEARDGQAEHRITLDELMHGQHCGPRRDNRQTCAKGTRLF
jgi:hypothetical protein